MEAIKGARGPRLSVQQHCPSSRPRGAAQGDSSCSAAVAAAAVMGDYGRIQAVILANLQGHVVYERFYGTFTDLERADLRAAMQVPSLLRIAAAWHDCGNLCLSAPAHACRPGPRQPSWEGPAPVDFDHQLLARFADLLPVAPLQFDCCLHWRSL